LDISSCFLSFPVHPDDLEFYIVQAAGDFYQFICLAFGHKSAPYIVTLLLNVVSSTLSDAGIEHSRYLDDFWIVGSSQNRAAACKYKAAKILCDAGLALALEKEEGPSQCLEYLGIIIDAITRTVRISAARLLELTTLLSDFQQRVWSSRTSLESLLGKLSFAAQVLPGARPFLRRIIDTIRSRPTGRIRLPGSFRSDVKYWLKHLTSWNGLAQWRRPVRTPFVFGSDASTSGFGYGLESAPTAPDLPASKQPGTVRVGLWSWSAGHAVRQSRSDTIQWGELFSPLAAVAEYGELLADSHIIFVIDNESDVHILNRNRTRDPDLSVLLRSICDAALQHNFSFKAVHRSGIKNELMDWSSRPDLHRFAATSPSFQPPQPPPHASATPDGTDDNGGGGGVGVVGGDGGADVCTHIPLTTASRLFFLNSRCLTFCPSGNSATWTGTSGGW
jgi:hypothetical protein